MKKKFFLLLLPIILILSCSTTKKSQTNTSTMDALSYSTAVFITEKTETTGVNAEYKWIRDHYTGYKVKMQSLNYKDKKPYDIITIVLSDGKEVALYFDISNYYGKF